MFSYLMSEASWRGRDRRSKRNNNSPALLPWWLQLLSCYVRRCASIDLAQHEQALPEVLLFVFRADVEAEGLVPAAVLNLDMVRGQSLVAPEGVVTVPQRNLKHRLDPRVRPRTGDPNPSFAKILQ